MSSNPKTLLTPEQYLEIERKAEYKSEYYNGEMFAMAGASLAHNRLVRNVVRDLGNQTREGPCEILPSDIDSPTFRAFGRVWLTEDFIGCILPIDVGKRVYLVGDCLQVENDEQRDARVKGSL